MSRRDRLAWACECDALSRQPGQAVSNEGDRSSAGRAADIPCRSLARIGPRAPGYRNRRSLVRIQPVSCERKWVIKGGGSAEEALATPRPATGRRLRVIWRLRVRFPLLALILAMLSGSMRFGYHSRQSLEPVSQGPSRTLYPFGSRGTRVVEIGLSLEPLIPTSARLIRVPAVPAAPMRRRSSITHSTQGGEPWTSRSISRLASCVC
jgi:hypothetical protein